MDAGSELTAFADRFEVRARLGAGAVGVVFQAYDRMRRCEVAVKALQRVDGNLIYVLKREFRALADLVHPNLVTLYELLSAGDQWAIAMELVDGVGFLEHVRTGHAAGELPTGTLQTGSWHLGVDPLVPGTAPKLGAVVGGGVNLAALERAFEQLVHGVMALHEAGKLHRDLKPSNVLVTREGRAVICDFGLVVEEGRAGAAPSSRQGTPRYMSPEQAAGEPLGPASDWYSVGVILYEALTGQPPHLMSGPELFSAKRTLDPPPPRLLVKDVPPVWSDLTMRLLDRDPTRRPTGREILGTLGGVPRDELLRPPRAFVGRDAELAALEDALAHTRRGHTVAVLVGGRSGMGKSSLVEHFLRDRRGAGDALVLAGRCYQRESVPYKALDTLVDELTAALCTLPPDELRPMLPEHLGSLEQLFPVIARVRDHAGVARVGALVPDKNVLRRDAFVALTHLIGSLAHRATTVLYLDDAQWGDRDSAPFFTELVHRPRAPLLLVCTYRSEESDSPVLEALRSDATGDRTGDVRDIVLGALSPDATRELAQSLAADLPPDRLGDIVREAAGNPFVGSPGTELEFAL